MRSEPELRRAEPRPGDIVAGKYKVEALLGRGAMGSVYAARNQGTGKRVALKWLLTERQADMEMITRFEREARAAGRIDHPNVVTVYDVGRDGPCSFLVMELLKGYSLYKLMKQGPIPPEAACQLIMPVIRGIGAAHDNQVIHRDLKPENVFVCLGPDGTPRNTKVLDFGVSKMTDEMREGLSVTRTGMIIGTPYYMSPEQVRGGHDIDHRIDVYAAGVILYEMIAGRPPFVAENYSGLVLEIATGTPPDLREICPDVSEGLQGVIDEAMAREREERFQDARSFGLALEPYAGGVTFDLQSAEWTQKIKLPRASTPPPETPQVVADSHAETLAHAVGELEESGNLERSGARRSADALDTSLERPPSKPDPDEAPTNAWHESTGQDTAPAKKKSFVRPALLVGAVLLVAIVAAVALSGGEGEETQAATETETQAATETATETGTETATETAAATETATATATDTVPADPLDEPADVEGPRPETRREGSPPTASAEAPETQTATETPTMRRRRGRRAMTAAMEAPTERAGTMMGMHRAGSLSLEDF